MNISHRDAALLFEREIFRIKGLPMSMVSNFENN